MYKLFYPDGNGSDSLVASFDNQQACYDKAVQDGQLSFTVQLVIDSEVVMVTSC